MTKCKCKCKSLSLCLILPPISSLFFLVQLSYLPSPQGTDSSLSGEWGSPARLSPAVSPETQTISSIPPFLPFLSSSFFFSTLSVFRHTFPFPFLVSFLSFSFPVFLSVLFLSSRVFLPSLFLSVSLFHFVLFGCHSSRVNKYTRVLSGSASSLHSPAHRNMSECTNK